MQPFCGAFVTAIVKATTQLVDLISIYKRSLSLCRSRLSTRPAMIKGSCRVNRLILDEELCLTLLAMRLTRPSLQRAGFERCVHRRVQGRKCHLCKVFRRASPSHCRHHGNERKWPPRPLAVHSRQHDGLGRCGHQHPCHRRGWRIRRVCNYYACARSCSGTHFVDQPRDIVPGSASVPRAHLEALDSDAVEVHPKAPSSLMPLPASCRASPSKKRLVGRACWMHSLTASL